MLALEKWCNKFQDGSKEFRPITGIWIRRLQAYRWIQQFHENKVAHGGNLFRTCRCLNIASPLALAPPQVVLNVNECMTWLEGLKKDATKLWNAHLCECLSSARVREDTALVIAIQKILRAELICCRWRLIWWAENPTRGGAVTWLIVPYPEDDTLYATREGVESQGVAAIKMWQGCKPHCPPLTNGSDVLEC